MKEVKLKNGQVAMVDDQDYKLVKKHKWYILSGYAVANINKTFISMHRLILGSGHLMIDHKNGQRLDNTRNNLRPCSSQLNKANSILPKNNRSGYKGVSWDKPTKKWRVQIGGDDSSRSGRRLNFGYYDCAIEAAYVYDAIAMVIYGEYAKTNQMLGLIPILPEYESALVK